MLLFITIFLTFFAIYLCIEISKAETFLYRLLYYTLLIVNSGVLAFNLDKLITDNLAYLATAIKVGMS